jgi:hypothetical protein
MGSGLDSARLCAVLCATLACVRGPNLTRQASVLARVNAFSCAPGGGVGPQPAHTCRQCLAALIQWAGRHSSQLLWQRRVTDGRRGGGCMHRARGVGMGWGPLKRRGAVCLSQELCSTHCTTGLLLCRGCGVAAARVCVGSASNRAACIKAAKGCRAAALGQVVAASQAVDTTESTVCSVRLARAVLLATPVFVPPLGTPNATRSRCLCVCDSVVAAWSVLVRGLCPRAPWVGCPGCAVP